MKCELCDMKAHDMHWCQCGHNVCDDCTIFCDICSNNICDVCVRENDEHLICDKCSNKFCIHGYLVSFNYKCECGGELIEYNN